MVTSRPDVENVLETVLEDRIPYSAPCTLARGVGLLDRAFAGFFAAQR